jgi:hypothetical protein
MIIDKIIKKNQKISSSNLNIIVGYNLNRIVDRSQCQQFD